MAWSRNRHQADANGHHSLHDILAPPLHRPELYDALALGERKLRREMDGRTKLFDPDDALVRSGAAHQWVYRVRTGWLAQARRLEAERRRITRIFLPGDLIGISNMLLPRQSETIECITAAKVDLIEQARFREVATADPDVALRVMYQFGIDERRLHAWIVGLGSSDAEARIAAMLLDFHSRLRRLGSAPRNSFPFPMTQQQVGDYTALTVQHVNRTLRRLRETGVAVVSHRTVIIGDPAALHRIARPMLDMFEQEQMGVTSGG